MGNIGQKNISLKSGCLIIVGIFTAVIIIAGLLAENSSKDGATKQISITPPVKVSNSLQISIPSDISKDGRILAEKTWPKIRAACPGLDKYAGDLQFVKIEEGGFYPLSFVFLVRENSNIPGEYRASGHNCFYEVDAKGSILSISKNPCKAVCLDQEVDGTYLDTGKNYTVLLK